MERTKKCGHFTIKARPLAFPMVLILLLLLGAKNVNTPVHWGRQNNMLLLLLLSFLKYPSTARMPSLYRAFLSAIDGLPESGRPFYTGNPQIAAKHSSGRKASQLYPKPATFFGLMCKIA